MITVKINNEVVDLGSDINWGSNFQISEIETLQGQKSSTTDTFKLPATKKNKLIFGNPNDWNSIVHVNQKSKPSLSVESPDGIVEFRGFAKVVASVEDNDVVSYTVKAIGINGDWISRMKGKYLTQLDFTKFNHDYTNQNIYDSWYDSTFIAKYGVSPQVYVYDLIDRGAKLIKGKPAKDEELYNTYYPSISAYHLIHKCFNNVGYRIESKLIESDSFKKLYLPFCGKMFRLNEEWKNDKYFKAVNDYTQSITFVGSSQPSLPIAMMNVVSNEGTDVSGMYQSVTSGNFKEFRSFTTGKHKFKFAMAHAIYGNATGIYTIHVCRRRFLDPYSTSDVSSIWSKEYNWGVQNTNLQVEEETEFLDLFLGDFVWIEIKAEMLNATGVGTIAIKPHAPLTLDFTYFSLIEYTGDLPVHYNQPVELSWNLPNKLFTDFIQGIFQLFNCEVTSDINSRTVYAEPYDDFYTGQTQDWTNLLDTSQPVDINFIGDKLSKSIRYKYNDDASDYNLKNISSANAASFASYEVEVKNNFAASETKDNSNKFFSQTYADPCDGRLGFEGLKGEFIPKMWKEQVPNKISTDFGQRLLIYDGVKIAPNGVPWTQYVRIDNGGYVTYDSFYFPRFYFAGNKVGDFNLSFQDTFNASGLFQRYFRNKHKVVDDSRVFTLYLKLNSNHISRLDFRSPVVIKFKEEYTYLTLQSVSGFNSDLKTSTRVELVKIVGVQPLSTLGIIHKEVRTAQLPNTSLFNATVVNGTTIISSVGVPVLQISPSGVVIAGSDKIYAEIGGVLLEVLTTSAENKIVNVIL
jgi:hypothetical protein